MGDDDGSVEFGEDGVGDLREGRGVAEVIGGDAVNVCGSGGAVWVDQCAPAIEWFSVGGEPDDGDLDDSVTTCGVESGGLHVEDGEGRASELGQVAGRRGPAAGWRDPSPG